jgi:fucose permease
MFFFGGLSQVLIGMLLPAKQTDWDDSDSADELINICSGGGFGVMLVLEGPFLIKKKRKCQAQFYLSFVCCFSVVRGQN